MIYVVLQVICAVTFSQLLRFGQMRLRPMFVVVAINYAVAMVVSGGRLWWSGGPVPDGLLMLLGFINGVLYFSHVPAMMASFHRSGVGITIAMAASGCIGPVLFAAWMWPQEEMMTVWRWVAVAMIPPTMFLLRPAHGERIRLSLRAELILLLPFLIAAVIGSMHKLASHYGGSEGHATYQAALFIGATVASSSWALISGERGNRFDGGLGLILGALNATGTLVLLLALSHMPASVYFSVISPTIIVVNLAVSRALWDERIARRQAIGIAMAVIVVLLASGG